MCLYTPCALPRTGASPLGGGWGPAPAHRRRQKNAGPCHARRYDVMSQPLSPAGAGAVTPSSASLRLFNFAKFLFCEIGFNVFTPSIGVFRNASCLISARYGQIAHQRPPSRPSRAATWRNSSISSAVMVETSTASPGLSPTLSRTYSAALVEPLAASSSWAMAIAS